MKTILAPVDFSDMAIQVIEEAAQLAKLLDAELRILHVAAPEPDFVGYEVGPQHVRDARAATLKEEHRQLADWAKRLSEQGVRCKAFLVPGRVVERILEDAETLPADLLVVGSHGRSAMYKALVGSVTENLLRKARVPVVVITPGALASLEERV